MATTERERLVDNALKMHHLGYNCAQSVACSLAPLVGLDKEEAFLVAEGLGGGMGGFDQTCGAISGGILTIGYARSEGSEKRCSKKETYALAHQLVERSQEQMGHQSASCADLRPSNPDDVMPTCDGYIAKAVELTLQILEENHLVKA